MADETEIVEIGLAEASKMDISQLRAITKELAADSVEMERFKGNPTKYLQGKMAFIPRGFHAHYAEGTAIVPAETMGGARERVAFSLPIGNIGTLSTCIICLTGCCTDVL